MSIALYVYLTLVYGVVATVIVKSADRLRVELKQDIAAVSGRVDEPQPEIMNFGSELSQTASKQGSAHVQSQVATKHALAQLQSQMATKQDLADISTKQDLFQQDLARLASQMATKQDLAELRSEMVIMRSDLTQVALAVGAGRSQTSND